MIRVFQQPFSGRSYLQHSGINCSDNSGQRTDGIIDALAHLSNFISGTDFNPFSQMALGHSFHDTGDRHKRLNRLTGKIE
ncbi:hypothetical protein D3C75_1056410 [compost metagenome]